jgi:hypothetical protein
LNNQEKKKINATDSTFETMKEQGRKLQEQRLKKPDAFYTLEFTDVEDKNNKILIHIMPDFDRKIAVLKVSDNFSERNLECLNCAVEMAHSWGLKKFRAESLTDVHLTKRDKK